MKHRLIAIFCLIALTVCLYGGFASAGDSSIILTVVNDSLLDLSSATMPVQRYGEWYVPYKVFADGSTTRSALGLIAAYNSSQQNMLVYDADGRSLNFQVSVGFVTDENGTYYSQPAYQINGTIYLPVKTVCNKFNFSYSYISSTYNYLRIVSSAKISNSLFAVAAQELAGKMINTYKNNESSSSYSENTSSIPVLIKPPSSSHKSAGSQNNLSEEIINPSTLSLIFCGSPSSSASSIVDSLSQYNIQASFFVDDHTILTEDTLIRKILAADHTIGIDIPESALSSADSLTSYLTQSNQDLFFITGITTRLCYISGSSKGKLDNKLLKALSDAGYRLWDYTDAPSGYNSSVLAENVSDMIHKGTDQCILKLEMTKTVSKALDKIFYDIQASQIETTALSEFDTPYNFYNYTK